MDTHVKVGQVYLQPQKQGKKWKKLWLALYPSSSRGVARLELQEVGLGEHGSVLGPGGARRHQEKKVIRLADCVSVLRLPPHAEACPGDNMAAFCVETDARRLVMAVEREECAEWVEKVCEIAFKRTGAVPAAQTPHMEENLIYVSREEVSDFWVSVQQTDAATRCDLQGAYWLQAASEELVLKEAETRKCLYAWPYRLLRRYGGDKLTFSVEAGRRCDSGPGTFTFDTRQSDQILSLIEAAIRDQRAGPGGTDGLLACDTLGPRRPRSPLPDLPTGASATDGHPPLKPASSPAIGSEECVYSQPADAIGLGKSARPQPSDLIRSEERVYSQPADCFKPKGTAPNSHMPLPLASLHSSPSASPHGNPTEPVYMDPVHYIPLNPPRQAAPALPSCCPPSSSSSSSSSQAKNQSEPVYDEVYHSVPPHLNQKQVSAKDGCKEEIIYTEACVGVRSISTPGSVHAQEVPKADPYAHLYAQVCKVKPNAPPSKSGDESPEIIYENLGII